MSAKLFTRASAAISGAPPAAQPTRHPVMLYVFDSEWNSIVTSRAPSISRMEGGR